MISLPIDAVVPALRQALGAQHQAVLEAPPGAGKTTRVPLALLDEPWLAGQRILMLEPRRLAARAAAERLAAELGERSARPSATGSAWRAGAARRPASKWSPRVFLPVACKTTRRWTVSAW